MLRRVVTTDSVDIMRPGVQALQAQGVEVRSLAGGSPQEKQDGLRWADAALVCAEPLTAAEIEDGARNGNLALAIRIGVGYDLIDVEAATIHGVWVANVPDYCTDEVADHTMALMLAMLRQVPFFLAQSRTNWNWFGENVNVQRLRGMKLGLVGAGRIGSAVAVRAQAFGMEVSVADPMPPPNLPVVLLRDLLQQSDVVSVHCPLMPSTYHLLNDEAFALMKEGSVFVNTGRGKVVSSDALLRALDRGRPRLAAIDVLEDEPAPDLQQPLLKHPHLLLTPHAAFYSRTSGHDLTLFAADNVLRFLNGGRPLHLINPTARG